MLVAMAELARSLILKRVKAGLRNARAKGKRLAPGPSPRNRLVPPYGVEVEGDDAWWEAAI